MQKLESVAASQLTALHAIATVELLPSSPHRRKLTAAPAAAGGNGANTYVSPVKRAGSGAGGSGSGSGRAIGSPSDILGSSPSSHTNPQNVSALSANAIPPKHKPNSTPTRVVVPSPARAPSSISRAGGSGRRGAGKRTAKEELTGGEGEVVTVPVTNSKSFAARRVAAAIAAVASAPSDDEDEPMPSASAADAGEEAEGEDESTLTTDVYAEDEDDAAEAAADETEPDPDPEADSDAAADDETGTATADDDESTDHQITRPNNNPRRRSRASASAATVSLVVPAVIERKLADPKSRRTAKPKVRIDPATEPTNKRKPRGSTPAGTASGAATATASSVPGQAPPQASPPRKTGRPRGSMNVRKRLAQQREAEEAKAAAEAAAKAAADEVRDSNGAADSDADMPSGDDKPPANGSTKRRRVQRQPPSTPPRASPVPFVSLLSPERVDPNQKMSFLRRRLQQHKAVTTATAITTPGETESNSEWAEYQSRLKHFLASKVCPLSRGLPGVFSRGLCLFCVCCSEISALVYVRLVLQFVGSTVL